MLKLGSLVIAGAVLVAAPAFAGGSHYVHSYVRKDGTYVQGHMATNPDGNFNNNWSTKGNINPYTGEEGTKVTPPPSESPYGQPADPNSSDPYGQ